MPAECVSGTMPPIPTKLQLLGGVHLHAGAHGGSGHAGLDILALGSGGLSLDDGADESGIVLNLFPVYILLFS